MDDADYSEEDIKQQLAALGFRHISEQRLREFKRDFDELVRHEKSKSRASSDWSSAASHSSSSPPPQVKEKVHLNVAPNRNYVPFKTTSGGQQSNIFSSTFHEDDHRKSDTNHLYDSYSCHVVAQKPHRPLAAHNRLEIEEGPLILNSAADDNESTSSGRENLVPFGRYMKRNVLRKRQGQSYVCDESIHSEVSAVGELEEHLDHMRIGTSRSYHDTECEDTGSSDDRSCSDKDDSLSALEDYSKCRRRANSEAEIQTRPKSFIRPVFDHPNTRNWKKSDPVARYFQYKQEWETFKPPGEKSRKELRWAIREQLVRQLPPQKSQKTYTANNYVPPNEKKRSALRWDIRHDLTHGLN